MVTFHWHFEKHAYNRRCTMKFPYYTDLNQNGIQSSDFGKMYKLVTFFQVSSCGSEYRRALLYFG